MSEWAIPRAHMAVLLNIESGRGAWFGAERPKQRGHRSGLLKDLRCHGLIDWTLNEQKLARYFLTESGKAAIAASGTTGEASPKAADPYGY